MSEQQRAGPGEGAAGLTTQKDTEGSLANLQPPAAVYQQQPALLQQCWHMCHLTGNLEDKNPYLTNNLACPRQALP